MRKEKKWITEVVVEIIEVGTYVTDIYVCVCIYLSRPIHAKRSMNACANR